MRVGVVKELWRYPVKSMRGEQLASAYIGDGGVTADRLFGVRDRVTGRIVSAKRAAALLGCRARYVEDDVEVEVPDGTRLRGRGPKVDALLSDLLGRDVLLARASGADRALIETGESSTSDAGPSSEFPAPPGTFFDSAQMHLITTSSLRRIRDLDSDSTYDRRRFRPNVVVDTVSQLEGFVEAEWVKHRLALGSDARVSVDRACGRCVMTTHAQDELDKEPAVLRTVATLNDNKLGVLGSVVSPGSVSVGDEVVIL